MKNKIVEFLEDRMTDGVIRLSLVEERIFKLLVKRYVLELRMR